MVFDLVPQNIKTNEQGIQRALDIQACSSSATFKAASELSFLMFDLERVKLNGTDQEKLDFLNNFSLKGPGCCRMPYNLRVLLTSSWIQPGGK